MRRDLVHYYERDIVSVFEAYKAAAMQKFGKNCRAEPYHTLSFGLNYSMRYNMNGGACTVHFMRYGTGTAVNIRYSIVQVAGARYGAHDAELSSFVTAALGVPVQDLNVPPEVFLQEQNKVTAAPQPAYRQPLQQIRQPQQAAFQQPVRQPQQAAQQVPQQTTPQVAQQTTPQVAQQQQTQRHPQTQQQAIRPKLFCDNCGTKIFPGARFCERCGKRL